MRLSGLKLTDLSLNGSCSMPCNVSFFVKAFKGTIKTKPSNENKLVTGFYYIFHIIKVELAIPLNLSSIVNCTAKYKTD